MRYLLCLAAGLAAASASRDSSLTSFLEAADGIVEKELLSPELPMPGSDDFFGMLSHLESSLKDAAHDLALDEPADDSDKEDVAPEDRDSPFPVDLLKDMIGNIFGEEAQRPVLHPAHTLLNVHTRLHDPQIRHVIVIGHHGAMPPLPALLGGFSGFGMPPTPQPSAEMHPHLRMIVTMHPHAFNPHLMIPPPFAAVPPPNLVLPPPNSLGHMLPPTGLKLPPIHFRVQVHGNVPHGSEHGEIPPELAEMVNEIVPKFVATNLPAILDDKDKAQQVRDVHVVKPHPALAVMTKNARANKPQANVTERVWDSVEIDNGMKFTTPLANVSVDAVKVQVKKDLLRVTGKDASGKDFAFVYPVHFDIDPSTVTAALIDSLLTVTVHKKLSMPRHPGIQWTQISRTNPLVRV